MNELVKPPLPGFTANIANFVRQEIRVPKSKPLLPVFEAVSNALDSIADRDGSGTVRVVIERDHDMIDGKRGNPLSFVIEDDGVGFDQDNLGSFNELYSDKKAERGGKGRGRFAYLKVFDRAEISSTFRDGGKLKTRTFTFDFNYRGHDNRAVEGGVRVGTSVRLRAMRKDYASLIPKEAGTIAKEFISHFLPILLSNRKIEIILIDGEEIKLADRVRHKLLIDARRESFTIGSREFTVQCARLRSEINLRHKLILAASSREVHADLLEKAIPVLSAHPMISEVGGDPFWFVAIVEGAFLDEAVDPMRVTFTDEDDAALVSEEITDNEAEEAPAPAADLFGEPQSIRQIRNEALKIVRKQLETHIDRAVQIRSDAIEHYIRRDGLGYHFLKTDIPEIAKNLRSLDVRSIEDHLHTAAYNERKKRSNQVSQLLQATPKEKSEEGYFERWSAVVDSIGIVAKSDLANYVAHRRVILDLIDDRTKTLPQGTYSLEEVLHSIVFPRGKQSGEVGYEQQNLWLIDERLTFNEHLYSDISIGKITDGEINSLQRPDLAIFESGFASFHDGENPPSHITLVELKQPGRQNVSKDDPVSKTLDYVEKLRAGRAKTEAGAFIDVEANALTTVYILSDFTSDFRKYLKREQFKQMPGDVGYYLFRSEENIMMIAMSFKRLIENARRRNQIFFKKLGIAQE